VGFHKRYIDDEQVIDIYRAQGNQGVIDWYTKGVDALITSGDLSAYVEEIIYSNNLVKEEKYNEISRLISIASIKKLEYEKKETTLTSS
jgi:hypothetical protein